jgi:hypothetical protein
MGDPVEKYYKLKKKYDGKYSSYKNTVMKKELTKIQKKIKISNYKRECINCKRNVGTFFSNKNKQLSIRCGDARKPCNLEYIVKVGSTGYIPDLIEYYYKVQEQIKKNIIQIKLSLLFGLESEENITETFTTLKEQYKQILKVLDNLEHYIFEDEKVTYQYMGEEHKKHRSQAILHFKKNLGNLIGDYNNIINSYEYDVNDTRDNILEDAIDKYKTEIIPLVKEMQSKFFDVIEIVKDTDEEEKKRLIKLVLYDEKYEVDYSKPEILSDKK